MSGSQMYADKADLVRKSSMAVTAIQDNLAGSQDDDMIETNVRSLRNLSEIIVGLTAILKDCPTLDSEDRPAGTTLKRFNSEEFRFWVPVEHHEKVRAAADAARQERDAYREGLRRIAEDSYAGGPELAILCDWEETTRHLRKIARSHLVEKRSGTI